MTKAFQEGADLHQLTADLLGCERQIAKSANFGLLYGSGAKGLRDYAGATGITMTLEEAKTIRDNWLDAYQGIKAWQRANADTADATEGNQWAETRIPVSGFRRFLPGDMTQKVDPYLRPLYDALYEMLGIERVAKLIERNVIEVAPLAFMRGRSLNDAFIILDEAQNTTVEQMKMFLTRIGFGSTAVVTGDITQIDLPKHAESGLRQAADVLKQQDGISFTFFASRDVVRHPLVQQIISAYEEYDRSNRGEA